MTQLYGVIFPGQGSQSLGMLAEMAEVYPEIQATFEEASNSLGYDLWTLCQQGPESQLNETEVTQPVLLAADVALWRILKASGWGQPTLTAGHSLGEYSALVASGALSFSDALPLVANRGRLMQQAVPQGQGGMAAVVGLTDETVLSLCQALSKKDSVVQPANYNAPGQVVVAGHQSAVTRVQEAGKEYGAKMVKPLAVSIPAHCSLMEPARVNFERCLDTIVFQRPAWPILHNLDAQSHRAETIKDAMAQQLVSPVRWVETIEAMRDHGITTFIECGPGKVLGGLNKRIDRSLTTYNMATPKQFEALANAMEERV